MSELKWKRKSPPQVSTNDDAQPLADWPIAASHNIFLLTRQRRLSAGTRPALIVSSPCKRSAAGRWHGVALCRVAAAPTRPTFVRPAVNLFTFLLKLPVLTASKSLRRSGRPWQSGPASGAARRSGSVPAVVPDGGMPYPAYRITPQAHTAPCANAALMWPHRRYHGLLRLARPAMKQRVQQDRPEGGRANPPSVSRPATARNRRRPAPGSPTP